MLPPCAEKCCNIKENEFGHVLKATVFVLVLLLFAFVPTTNT